MSQIAKFISEIFNKSDSFFQKYLGNILDKAYNFFKGNYTVLAIVLFFVGLIFLIGFIRWLVKSPRLLFFVFFLLGIVIVIWWFFGRESATINIFNNL